MRQIGFQLTQPLALLLGAFSFRYVHHGAHHFDQLSRSTENGASYGVEVFNGSIREHDSVLLVDGRSAAHPVVAILTRPVTVVRMDPLQDRVAIWRPLHQVESPNPEHLLRPVDISF